MTIDWTKPIQTRDGRKARYLGTLAGDYAYPIVVAVECRNEETVSYCSNCGVQNPSGKESTNDIINVPPQPVVHTTWLVVADMGRGICCTPLCTSESAHCFAETQKRFGFKVFGIKRVTITEGEGLSND